MLNCSWIPARPDRYEQTVALCDTRPRVETRVLYPGDSVHLQCRRDSRVGAVVWRKDNRTLDLTAERLLLTVDGGVVVVNVRYSRLQLLLTAADSGLWQRLRSLRVLLARTNSRSVQTDHR